MATFEVDGLTGLTDVFNSAEAPPEEVKKDILQAMGAAAMQAVSQEGRSKNIYSDYAGKHMLDSITLTKPKINDKGGVIYVTFAGDRQDRRHKKKTRQAKVAFVNEYGTKTQRARPFISPALKKKEAEIVSAGEKVYDRWIESINGRN